MVACGCLTPVAAVAGDARFGWCTAKADVQRSIGADDHGYGIRDVNGAKVHAGVREYYGKPFGA